MAKKLTKEEFISRAIDKHGDKFDYSLVEYKNYNSKKIKIICPSHGIIEVTPSQHVLYDCGKCSGKVKLDKNTLILQFKEKHNNKYDYSQINYINDRTKIEINCPTHGRFWMQPNSHKKGQGCPSCGREKINKSIKDRMLSNKEFINKLEENFGKNCFDFSELTYNGAHTSIKLKCNKCNQINQKTPITFYQIGCNFCNGKTMGKKKYSNEYFLSKAKLIHGDRYDYSLVEYKGNNEKIKIICYNHGLFEQTASAHINAKSGCPECKTSKGEEQIGIFLNKNHINYIFQHQVKINNSYHYFDFYIPDKNLIIEFNGMQHYKPIKFFGGADGFEYLQERDKIKNNYCIENNINLLIIPYNEDIEEILKTQINNIK